MIDTPKNDGNSNQYDSTTLQSQHLKCLLIDITGSEEPNIHIAEFSIRTLQSCTEIAKLVPVTITSHPIQLT